MSFEADLDALAAEVAKEAQAVGTPFADRLDALKVLTAFYSARKKHAKDEDEDEGGFSFDKVTEEKNGRARKTIRAD